jgi:hypothetical protein
VHLLLTGERVVDRVVTDLVKGTEAEFRVALKNA